MLKYFLHRLAILLPTLIGVTIVVFAIINMAPGGPIEQRIQQMRFGGGDGSSSMTKSTNRGSEQGVSNEIMEALKKQYGFDKPVHERYFLCVIRIDIA